MKTKKSDIQPLSWRLVPENFRDFYGQKRLFGKGMPLRSMVESGNIVSSLLWGPPGTGKTAFSRFIAAKLNYKLVYVNAVSADTAKMKEIMRVAEFEKKTTRTLLVVDEIEHFSRSQQDIFLPALEKGDITMMAITFENPYYRMNTALMSRLKIFEFKELCAADLDKILKNALSSEKGLAGKVKIADKVGKIIVDEAAGDARRLLNLLEMLAMSPTGGEINESDARKILTGARKYDRENHYDMISAFIKSVRGSDADSALYWLAQMLKGGEDPRFIARRLIILASEDIGNADPQALPLAVAAYQAVDIVGLPEARIILSQATIYCASTFKSNASYEAVSKAEGLCGGAPPSVPAHLTKKGAANYKYPHAYGGWVRQRYSDLSVEIYKPKGKGFEKELERRTKIVRKVGIESRDESGPAGS